MHTFLKSLVQFWWRALTITRRFQSNKSPRVHAVKIVHQAKCECHVFLSQNKKLKVFCLWRVEMTVSSWLDCPPLWFTQTLWAVFSLQLSHHSVARTVSNGRWTERHRERLLSTVSKTLILSFKKWFQPAMIATCRSKCNINHRPSALTQHPSNGLAVNTFVSSSGPVVLLGCVWYINLLLKCVMEQTASLFT